MRRKKRSLNESAMQQPRERWKQLLIVFLLVWLTVCFVQLVGVHLVSRLSNLDVTEDSVELEIEEKIMKQMVLQLDPREYYTIQVGTYSDVMQSQEKIDQLSKMGYSVFVSEDSPYQLCIGCVGRALSMEEVPKELVNIGEDVFIQKRILNQTTFRFPSDDAAKLQEVAVLITSFHVVLNHSLNLFQDYRYEACNSENWNEMIVQVQAELAQIQLSADNFLLDDGVESYADDLLLLLSAAENYSESLDLIVEKKNTKVVLLAQSCLLELIDCYHNFIAQSSVRLAT